FRLFLLEASIIAAAAAALGLALALAALWWMDGSVPGVGGSARFRIVYTLTPDWRMFAAALAGGVIASISVGGIPAWRGSRTPPLRMFGASGVAMATPARGKWLRTLFVAVQVSSAAILLFATGLYLIRGLTDTRLEIAYDTHALATARLEFDEATRDYE